MMTESDIKKIVKKYNCCIAKWSTATRPTSPSIGQEGYNTDLNAYEYWNGSAWITLQDGRSAYQVWLDNGHSGTEADFLNSLIGASGANGTSGEFNIVGSVDLISNLPASYTPTTGQDAFFVEEDESLYVWYGSGWGKILYDAAIQRYITTGNNLFNKDTAVLNEYIHGGNGNIVSSANWWRSDYVAIKESTTYSAINAVRDRAYYDANKIYISGETVIATQFTTPANAAYVRFSHYTYTANPPADCMLNEGATALPWEKFRYKFKYGDLYEDLHGIISEFYNTAEYDSLTPVISPTTENIITFIDIAGVGANFNKVGVSFNAIRLAGAKRGAIDPSRYWNFAQVVVKNAKEDATIIAKSPLIGINPNASELTDLVFPLMDENLENFVTLDDSSFSGSTYFVYHIFFNEDGSYAFGGTAEGAMSNYAGTSFYTTTSNQQTWHPYSGNPSIGLEHVLLTNQQLYKNLQRLDLRIKALEEIEGTSVEMQLPTQIDMVTNDTLQLYYSSLIAFPNWERFHFASTLSGGKDLKRYLEFVPTTPGDRTLTIYMYNEKNQLVDSKSTTIKVRNAVQQPASTLNFWTVGDSLTNNPTYTDEMVRRLTGTGGTPAGNGFGNIVNHREGNSGKQWNWYVTNPASPFIYSGVLNFEQYRIDNALAVPDVVYILLTWNGMGSDRTQSGWDIWDDDVYTFIDALKADFPSVEVKLCSPQFPSQNGGLGYVDGAAASGYPNTFLQNRNCLKQAEIYDRISNEASYSAWVEHVNTALQVDSKYNMPFINKAVNSRNAAITEMIGTNDVHPADEGYYQIADALFRNFVVNYCQ